MSMQRFTRTLVAEVIGIGMWGCQQPDMAEIAAKQKARPAELDQLEAFVGRWEATFEAKMMGSDEVMKGSGSSHFSWGVGNRFLVEQGTMEMGPEWGSMTGTGYWTWDPSIGKFRTWWFDNWGVTGSGTLVHNAKKKQWRMRASSRNTVDGRKTMFKGSMTFIDNDTLEWEFAEYDALGLIKYLEMKGTSRKQ